MMAFNEMMLRGGGWRRIREKFRSPYNLIINIHMRKRNRKKPRKVTAIESKRINSLWNIQGIS